MTRIPMDFALAPPARADRDAIETLLDAAFGADRHARTAYRIRSGTDWIASLSFAAFAGERLVGSLQSWPIALDSFPLTLVGPVAVAPDAQNQGIGRALMAALLAAVPRDPLVMIGDPDYYGRFGFTAAATQGWTVPGPVERHRLLARFDGELPRVGTLGPRVLARA